MSSEERDCSTTRLHWKKSRYTTIRVNIPGKCAYHSFHVCAHKNKFMSGDERDLVNLFSLGNKRNKYFCNLRMFLCNTSAYIINSFCCCGDERECVILLRHLFEWVQFQNKQNKYSTLIFLISWLRGQRKFSNSIFLIIVV